MKTTTNRTIRAAIALPVTALVMAACGSTVGTDDDDGGAGERAGGRDASPVAAQTPSDDATDEAAEAGPVTTIPASLALPHEDSWRPVDDGADYPLPSICLDPSPALAGPAPTDRRGVSTTDEDGLPGEYLGLYADDDAAGRAVDAWRQRTAECGGPGSTSHTGESTEWTVTKAAVDGADESWQAYETSALDSNGEDISQADPFLTVARVGNAVYVETYVYPGRLDDAAVAERSEAGADSVASFLPRLADLAPDEASATADDFPDAVDAPVQGEKYGVVVLSDGTDAEVAASQEAVAAYDFTAYTAEIGCLQGAGPALGIPDGTIVSYLVFADVDAAKDFTSLYTYLDEDAEVQDAVEAKVYCVDD